MGAAPLFGRDPHPLDVVPPEDLHGNIPRLQRLGGRRRFSVKETLRRRQERNELAIMPLMEFAIGGEYVQPPPWPLANRAFEQAPAVFRAFPGAQRRDMQGPQNKLPEMIDDPSASWLLAAFGACVRSRNFLLHVLLRHSRLVSHRA